MKKKEYLNKTKKLKLKRNTKEFLKIQIELFYNYTGNQKNNYNIGDEITLSQNSLIHGSRADYESLKLISSTGIISSEFYSIENSKKKKPYVVEFWELTEKIKLSDWIKKYAGVTIEFQNKEGKVYKSIISNFSDIENNIKNEKNYRSYTIYQNQEQRFVPNDTLDNDWIYVKFLDTIFCPNSYFVFKFIPISF